MTELHLAAGRQRHDKISKNTYQYLILKSNAFLWYELYVIQSKNLVKREDLWAHYDERDLEYGLYLNNI